MYNTITFTYNGRIVKGILLGSFDSISNIKQKNYKTYIVFIPWKHSLKNISLIDEKNVISINYVSEIEFIEVDEFISEFTQEEPYYSEYSIRNFIGYKFIYEDVEFIANVMNGLVKYPLEILYENIPSILNEEFDEEEINEAPPLFITYNEKKGKGTCFIELQYCKCKKYKCINQIEHWNEESLYIGIDSLNLFLNEYLEIFNKVNKIDIYSYNYFTFNQVKKLRSLLLEQMPTNYNIIVKWLDICIDKGYTMYLLGI